MRLSTPTSTAVPYGRRPIRPFADPSRGGRGQLPRLQYHAGPDEIPHLSRRAPRLLAFGQVFLKPSHGLAPSPSGPGGGRLWTLDAGLWPSSTSTTPP